MQVGRVRFVWQYLAAVAAILAGALITNDMAHGAEPAQVLVACVAKLTAAH